MARIAGVEVPSRKRLKIGLTYIFGIGRTTALQVCERAGLNPEMRVGDLTEEQVSRINSVIEADFTVEGALRRQIQQNVQRLIQIGCYRGLRHRAGLPVRGQRTRTNARTRKGPRRTVAGKKKAPAPK